MVEEIESVVDSLWDTHGDDKWKSKLLVKDMLVPTLLQQVSQGLLLRDQGRRQFVLVDEA